MNYFILAASIISLMAVVGHFTMGAKEFLKPVMVSDVDEIPKNVMKSLFHYMSVFLVISTLLLFLTATNFNCILFELETVAKLLAVMYAGFGLSQLIIALNSPIKKGPIKMFQWIFWLLIAILIFVGV